MRLRQIIESEYFQRLYSTAGPMWELIQWDSIVIYIDLSCSSRESGGGSKFMATNAIGLMNADFEQVLVWLLKEDALGTSEETGQPPLVFFSEYSV